MATKNYTSFFRGLFLIILILKTVAQDAPSLGSTLPKIDQVHYQLTPNKNGYALRIILPDDDQRDEIVELKNPGTPQEYLTVKGISYTHYLPRSSATVTYTADQNGYYFKYKYEIETIKTPFIGPNALKSAAG